MVFSVVSTFSKFEITNFKNHFAILQTSTINCPSLMLFLLYGKKMAINLFIFYISAILCTSRDTAPSLMLPMLYVNILFFNSLEID